MSLKFNQLDKINGIVYSGIILQDNPDFLLSRDEKKLGIAFDKRLRLFLTANSSTSGVGSLIDLLAAGRQGPCSSLDAYRPSLAN